MCDCCGRTQDDQGNPVVLGTLAMPERRLFMVCADCVNFMWHGRHAMTDQDVLGGE